MLGLVAAHETLETQKIRRWRLSMRWRLNRHAGVGEAHQTCRRRWRCEVCLECSSTKLNANRVCGSLGPLPSSNLRLVATIPTVAKRTQPVEGTCKFAIAPRMIGQRVLDCCLVVRLQIWGVWPLAARSRIQGAG